MSRRLDIGIASYGAPEKLQRTVASIQQNSTTDWRLFVIDNPHPHDETVRQVIADLAAQDKRIVPYFMDRNGGYAGAVNKLFALAETEYIAYCDNDIQIHTHGWDEQLCSYLDRFHEIGWMFPNGGAYPLDRGNYQEILWCAGFCWIVSRMCMMDTGEFDEALGHQEEPDYALRVRMAGYRIAADPGVRVKHDATATSSSSQQERISRGVVNWVNKWNRYFNGKNFDYHSPNVTRWHDWPPNALYLEEYFQKRIPNLNACPEQIDIRGEKFDLLRVPRLSGYYTGRVI